MEKKKFGIYSFGLYFRKLKVGPPNEDVFMGPLISQIHLNKVKSYVAIAREEGAKILCGESVEELDLPAANQRVFICRRSL